MNQLHVYRFLPKKLVDQVGAYTQTCAHMELFAAILGACLSNETVGSSRWITEYSEIRKLGTSALIERLRSLSRMESAQQFSLEIKTLCDHLDAYKLNRHIGVHGAFFGLQDGTLRVDYIQNKGSRKSPMYERTETKVTASLVEEAVCDADFCLHAILGMITKLGDGLIEQSVRAILPHAVVSENK